MTAISDEQIKQPDEGEPVTPVHPFADPSRRADVTLYPPVPGMVMQLKKVTVHATEGQACEFADEKGNYYKFAGIPYAIVSYDPGFDPDTEGRIIRGGGGGLA